MNHKQQRTHLEDHPTTGVSGDNWRCGILPSGLCVWGFLTACIHWDDPPRRNMLHPLSRQSSNRFCQSKPPPEFLSNSASPFDLWPNPWPMTAVAFFFLTWLPKRIKKKLPNLPVVLHARKAWGSEVCKNNKGFDSMGVKYEKYLVPGG